MICGILHGGHVGVPRDTDGCRLPDNHQGWHEYLATNGRVYEWETDLECDCDHCMRADGDYCTTYRLKEGSESNG